jgi:ActR/RegA family two-component response regulator
MNTTNQLTTEELKQLQDLQADFTKSKIALGDLELEKQNVFKHIESLKAVFAENEKVLIQKYGANAVINIKTGEVTYKES